MFSIAGWWRGTQRKQDLNFLWPQCRAQAVNLELARMAFLYHALQDTAWTKDFTEEEIRKMVGELK